MRKLKRILIFAALVVALTCLLCVALSAETYSGTCGAEGDNLTWTLDTDTGVLKIEGEGEMADYNWDNNAPWYEYRSDITTVEISDGVTSIGDDAFAYSYNLVNVTIPSSVTSIGAEAFFLCTKFADITIPSNVTSIGDYAFSCTVITSISIPSSVTSIGINVFEGCTALKYNEYEGVLYLGNSDNPYHVLVKVKDTVADSYIINPQTKIILHLSFNGCYRVDNINVPKGVISIGNRAFSYCNSLTDISIPETVTNIGDYAFYYCGRLTSIHIPSSVISIGTCAFSRCGELESITAADGNPVYHSKNNCLIETESKTLIAGGNNSMIPDDGSVINIAESAFDSCWKIKELEIPSCIVNIKSGAFWHCSGIEVIIVADGNPVYHSKNNCLIETESKTLIVGCKGSIIPDDGSVTSIGTLAFAGQSGLKKITIPGTVTEIGYRAFESCDGLKDIIISDGVKIIGKLAFNGCNAVNINIPSSMERIEESAFSSNGIASIRIYSKTVWISENLRTLSYNAVIFGYKGSTAEEWANNNNHKFVDIEGGTVIIDSGTCGENLTWTIDSEFALKISGIGAMTEYDLSTDIPWYKYISGIKTIEIADGVTSIGDSAFAGCSNLTDIKIPGSITAIGAWAFRSCTLLAYNVHENVLYLGNEENPYFALIDAGDNYDSSYAVHPQTKIIAGSAFRYCRNIRSITVPESVIFIGKDAFDGWGDLRKIKIYSKDTVIYDSENTIPSGTVFGYKGSTAETYAEKYCLTFVDIVTGPITVANGTCGDNLKWTLDSDGLLKIIGTGDMYDYGWNGNTPWDEYKEDIITVEISDGVTSIGSNVFLDCRSLVGITIPEGVTRIGIFAFTSCVKLTSVDIPSSLTNIEYNAFLGCESLSSINVNEANPVYKSIDGVLFTKDATAVVQYPMGKDEDTYKIPSGVTKIENGAFFSCDNIVTIVIPESVVSIGYNAFSSCGNLTNINIPDSLEIIDSDAFSFCTSLTEISIPAGVNIRGNIFRGCKSLIAINVDAENPHYKSVDGVLFTKDGKTLICYPAAAGMEYTIPNGVDTIGSKAFERAGIVRITIPGSVNNIREYAFYCCDNLTKITIYSKTVTIYDSADTIPSAVIIYGGKGSTAEEYATKYGRKFVEIDIPTIEISNGTCGENLTWVLDSDGLLKISGTGAMTDYDWDDNAPWYEYRSDIITVEIQDGVTSIGDMAFYSCINLANITIPNSVTSIGDMALYGCGSLTSITIPSGVTSIGSSAFTSCGSLASINVDEANEIYKSIDGVLFTKDGKALMAYPAGKSETAYTIPDGVTIIESCSFLNCISLTSINIPDSVISIGISAFLGCQNLININIPDGVTAIQLQTFFNCNSLKTIILPAKITRIDNGAFYLCKNLESITIYSKTAQIYDSEYTIPESATIYGGKGSTAEEYATKYGRKFVEIDIPTIEVASGTCGENLTWVLDSDGLLKISGTGAMRNLQSEYEMPWYIYKSNITAVEFADGVTSIGTLAFVNCGNIANITISNSVKSIGENSFRICNGLTSVTIPDGVTDIGAAAFGYCSSLTEVSIPSSVTNIGDGAFCACNSLVSINVDAENPNYKSVEGILFTKDGKILIQCPAGIETQIYTVPSDVTEIGIAAFAGCKFSEVKLHSDIKVIGDGAFMMCVNLVSISLPDDITRIGYATFAACISLENIIIPSNVTEIDFEAFYGCASLTSIIIPRSIAIIGNSAFEDCDNLASVTIYSKTASIVGKRTFPTNATIYGFDGSTAQAYAEKYGNTFVEIVCTNHQYGSYKMNDDGHWLECFICGEKKNEEAHTFAQKFDKTGHWNECTVCGFVKDKSEHNPDAEGKCTECDFGKVKLGDINGDGKVDVKDLMLLRRHMAAYSDDNFNGLAADINGDGKINTTDLMLMRRYLAGISGTGIE